MRVIAGEFRSRPIKTLEGLATRPTPDRLREALFNVLQTRIEGAVFVDAHAGSGAIGIEAISRGARQAIFIERSKEAADIIHENLRSLRLGTRTRVIRGAAGSHLGAQTADIVFLDPPYELVKEYENSFRVLAGKTNTLVIAQHATREKLAESYGDFRRTRVIRQGENSLSFYSALPGSTLDDSVGAEPQDAVAPTDGISE